MFDTLGEVIAGGVILLLSLLLVLAYLKKGGKVKVGNVDVGQDEKVSVTTLPCDAYQHEHMVILQELKTGLGEVAAIVRGLDRLQIAQSEGLDVLLGLAEGDEINGQVTRARRKLAVAEGFKEATEGGPV